MSITRRRKLVAVVGLVLMLFLSGVANTCRVSADTTTYSGPYNYDNSGSRQYRFIVVTKTPQWTGNHYVSGQPTKGTYLKKGDMMSFNYSGGSSYSVSIGVGLGVGSVSVSIPTGKLTSSAGTIIKASSSGYYKLAVNKQIKATVKLIQYRTRQNGGWSSWTKAGVYSTSYELVRQVPSLVKQ